MNRLNNVLAQLSANRSLVICLVIMFLTTFARQSNSVFTQFGSKLLGISIAQTSYIQSAKAFALLGVFVAVIIFSQIVERRSSARMIYWDVWICRLNLGLLVIGSIILSFGKILWVVVLGKYL
jgi:hypothetical protein